MTAGSVKSATSTSATVAENNECSGWNYNNLPSCPAVSYTFTVAAVNSRWDRAQSSASNAVGTPGYVQNYQESGGCTQVSSDGNETCSGTFTWTLPTNTGGAPITAIYYYLPNRGLSEYLYCYAPAFGSLSGTATSLSTCYYGASPYIYVQNAFGAISQADFDNLK